MAGVIYPRFKCAATNTVTMERVQCCTWKKRWCLHGSQSFSEGVYPRSVPVFHLGHISVPGVLVIGTGV